ncbi:hypothetical protein EDB85DRAFT_367004 [Lactarius pseudohatsudake]|nr:hypothetical protein EDB85DRAFT_367004 [Lactarius pseudohatsudake]
MSLAALKPTDRSDMGHFYGLGPSSNQDALLVCIEPKPPTKCKSSWNTEIGAKRKWDAEGQGRAKRAQFHRVRVRLLPDKTTLGAMQSVLWKQALPRFYLVWQQRHFPEGRRGLFGYGKRSQAHVLKLGCVLRVPRLIALALRPFVRKYIATVIPAPYRFCARTSAPPCAELMCQTC